MNVLEVHILQDRMQEIWGNRNPFTHQILRDKFKTVQGRKEFFDDNWKILNNVGINLGRYNEYEKFYGEDSPWNCICYKTKVFKTSDPNTVVNEKENEEKIYFYNNYKVFYFKKDGTKVRGTWKCDGEEDYTIQYEDGTTYLSKVGTGNSSSGKSGNSGSGKSGTSGSGKSGTPTSNISLPYELKGSFTTPKSQPNAIEESINLKNVEKEVETILRKIYTDKINPKIRDIDFSVVDNGDSYTTNYNIFIDKSNDKKAWVGFKSFGAAGENYKNRADQNLDRGILSLDNKFGVELFGGRENTGIPFKVHFTQFRLPKQFPNHKVNESKIQRLIVDRLKDRFEEKKIQEDIVEKRLDYVISQLKETKNYKNINQYKRTKLFIEELKELESCGLL